MTYLLAKFTLNNFFVVQCDIDYTIESLAHEVFSVTFSVCFRYTTDWEFHFSLVMRRPYLACPTL